MSLLKRLFGIKTTDFNQLLEDGAYIVDVRNPGEFNSGNIKESTKPVDAITRLLRICSLASLERRVTRLVFINLL